MTVEEIKEKYACDMSLNEMRRESVMPGRGAKERKARYDKFNTPEARAKADKRSAVPSSGKGEFALHSARNFFALLKSCAKPEKTGRSDIDSIVDKVIALIGDGAKKTEFALKTYKKMAGNA